jgi:hypothetical protein
MRRAIVTICILLGFGRGSFELSQEEPRDVVAVRLAVAPQFPDIAVQAAISIRFVVHVDIGRDGVPTEARMEPRFVVFHDSVEAAAKAWRFVPDASATQPVRKVDLVFNFKVLPKGSKPTEAITLFRPPYEVETRREVVAPSAGPRIH